MQKVSLDNFYLVKTIAVLYLSQPYRRHAEGGKEGCMTLFHYIPQTLKVVFQNQSMHVQGSIDSAVWYSQYFEKMSSQ